MNNNGNNTNINIALLIATLGSFLTPALSAALNVALPSIGRAQIIPKLYPQFLVSMKSAFIVFAILCLAGIFAALACGKMYGG